MKSSFVGRLLSAVSLAVLTLSIALGLDAHLARAAGKCKGCTGCPPLGFSGPNCTGICKGGSFLSPCNNCGCNPTGTLVSTRHCICK
jgi:hypothetical protein